MRTFTKEEIDKLSVQELNFHRAVYSQYKCATDSKTDNMIYEIYVDATGDKSLSKNWGCSYCSYKLYLKAGEKYFKDKQALEELTKKEENADNKAVTNKKGKKATTKK